MGGWRALSATRYLHSREGAGEGAPDLPWLPRSPKRTAPLPKVGGGLWLGRGCDSEVIPGSVSLLQDDRVHMWPCSGSLDWKRRTRVREDSRSTPS